MRERHHQTKDPKWFRAVAICDPHFSSVPPPSFKADYLALLESSLRQAFAFALRQNADAILWGGDLFHRKDPKNNPLALVTRVIKLLTEEQKAGFVHAGIGGNHDLRYGSLEAGLPGSPLEVLLEAGLMTLLDHEELIFRSQDGFTTRLAGGSYHHGQASHVRDKQKRGADRLVTLGHFWLGTQTGEFYGEPLYGHDYFKDGETDVLVIGHHHEDKGIHSAHGKHFAAPGSITITGAHEHDLTRRPAATFIETSREETRVRAIRPKFPPASDVLDLEKHLQLKQEREEADAFIATLARTELTTLDPADILNQMAPPREVKERVAQYLEAAEIKR